MTIKLLHNSPLWLVSHAIRMSHDNHDKSDTTFQATDGYGGNMSDVMSTPITGDYVKTFIGVKDRGLIARVGNKLKHKSVLEQLVYWFDIDGISRACLQEVARHRTARLTVKSSRYTLKELKDCYVPTYSADMDDKIKQLYVRTGNKTVDGITHDSLFDLCESMEQGLSNDIAKYCLPEAFKTRLQWQIDGRNLQNFLELRTSKDALWEIQNLARAIYDALPSEHKYLYEEYVR